MKKFSTLAILIFMCVIHTAFAQDFMYEIDNFSFSGEELPSADADIDGKFFLSYTKKYGTKNTDTLAVVSYDESGRMLDISTSDITQNVGESSISSTLRSPAGKKAALVKAFIWDSKDNMLPLSKSAEAIMNPGAGSADTYIPDSLKIMAKIVDTPFNRRDINSNQYIIRILDFDTYTEGTYEEYITRRNDIAEAYGINTDNPEAEYILTSDTIFDEYYLFSEMEMVISRSETEEFILSRLGKTITNGTYSVYCDLNYHTITNEYRSSGLISVGDSSIKLSESFDLYINGSFATTINRSNEDADMLLDKYLDKTHGIIHAVHDGKDKCFRLYLPCYDIAKVLTVNTRYSGKTTVTIEYASDSMSTAETIRLEEGIPTLVSAWSDYLDDGSAPHLKTLCGGDIIAISTNDWAESTQIFNPRFFKMKASRKTVSGMLDSVNDQNKTYSINYQNYKVLNYKKLYPIVNPNLQCTASLDPFGRIFDIEMDQPNADDVYNQESRFAVVRKKPVSAPSPDGDPIYVVNSLYGSEETDLYFLNLPTGLEPGDVFFFEPGNDGLITDYHVIYDQSKIDLSIPQRLQVNADGPFMGFTGLDTSKYNNVDDYGWSFTLWGKKYINLFAAVITDYNNSYAEFARISEDGTINLNKPADYLDGDGYKRYKVSDYTESYVYNVNDTGVIQVSDRIYSSGKIYPSDISIFETEPGSGIYDVTAEKNGVNPAEYLNYAIVMAVDDEVVCIYEIIQR